MKKLTLLNILLLTTQFVFSQWIQQGTDIDGEAANDFSGRSVSLSSDGNRVAIGARENDGNGTNSGHVRIYEFQGGNWVQLGNDIDGEAEYDDFGWSVSLNNDGSRVAIGGRWNNDNGNNSGHVRIYEFQGGSWVQLGIDIDGEASWDESGWSVSLNSDGSRVAIGAWLNDGNGTNSGHVRIYEFQGGNWVQLGNDIDGEAAFDQSGHSVSLNSNGSRVAIGARENDGNGIDSGHVRIYEFDGINWVQLGNDIDGETADDHSGSSISLNSDGSRVAIGATGNDGNGPYSGHVRIYEFDGINWIQLGTDIDGEAAEDRSGVSVSLNSDGSRVAIGAYTNDGNGDFSGHVRIYEFDGINWVQLGSDIDGEAASDVSGFSVSFNSDGNQVAIGAYANSGSEQYSGHVRVYQFIAPGLDTVLGEESGFNSSGEDNVFIGYRSGYNTTTGDRNTFVGSQSGFFNHTGSGNLFLGAYAGYNETGSDRLYIDNSDTTTPLIWGDFATDALRLHATVRITNIPQNNTLTQVLVANDNGDVNWRDAASLASVTQAFPSYPESAGDGGDNTNSYFGHEAGLVNTGIDNTFLGHRSGYNNTSGNYNTATGVYSLQANQSGNYNTATGVYTLQTNQLGNYNTAHGSLALRFNISGNFNTTIGYRTLYENTTGSRNTATGNQALSLNITGNLNTAHGDQALYSNSNGNSNTALGHNALTANTSGNNNVALGSEALQTNTTGAGNIAVGYDSGTASNNLNNTIAIGQGATVTGDNAIAIGEGTDAGTDEVRIGNLFTASIGGYQPWSNLSDGRFKQELREDIPGLEFITSLRPVSYTLNHPELSAFLKKEQTKASKNQRRSVGFIAQEVEQVLQENGYTPIGIETPQNENDHYSIRYAEFVVPLTKAVQELSTLVKNQQQEIEALKAMIYGTGGTSSPTTGLKPETALAEGFKLEQNIPNPFDEDTIITVALPTNISQAKIVIYNLQGVELQSYPLNERGKTSVKIKGGLLQSGMYLYALLADGQLIDTKKMILTK